jgi:hypothetical protein
MEKENTSLRAPQGRGNLPNLENTMRSPRRCAPGDDMLPAINEREKLPLLKDGLPWQAFAMVPDKEHPEGWQLPHHTKESKRTPPGKDGYEHTVDWRLMEKATLLLSRFGDEGKRVAADPELIIRAARHLAEHYRKKRRQIPDILCVLI